MKVMPVFHMSARQYALSPFFPTAKFCRIFNLTRLQLILQSSIISKDSQSKNCCVVYRFESMHVSSANMQSTISLKTTIKQHLGLTLDFCQGI